MAGRHADRSLNRTKFSFNPEAVAHSSLAKRLRVCDGMLPPDWVARRLPEPALPIDECVHRLIRKGWIRNDADLRAAHKLGECPFAVARFGVMRAAVYAGTLQSNENDVKPAVFAALKYLKEDAPRLCIQLYPAEMRAQLLLGRLDLLGLSLPRLKRLYDALSRSRILLESMNDDIASLHRELSKHRGNVWRLSFVTALFAEWWVLTAKDPKSSPGPCQEFICAAWCSLSPSAAPTDADWGSAIKVGLARCEPGRWRVV